VSRRSSNRYLAAELPPSRAQFMRRPSRLTAVVAHVLIVQVVLLGSGVVCTKPNIGGVSGAICMNMADTHGRPAPASPSSNDQRAPCKLPWAPAGCHAATPCAPAAVTSPQIVLASRMVVTDDVMRVIFLAPTSLATPPELPPPRA
jgi:hypothetical protein